MKGLLHGYSLATFVLYVGLFFKNKIQYFLDYFKRVLSRSIMINETLSLKHNFLNGIPIWSLFLLVTLSINC